MVLIEWASFGSSPPKTQANALLGYEQRFVAHLHGGFKTQDQWFPHQRHQAVTVHGGEELDGLHHMGS